MDLKKAVLRHKQHPGKNRSGDLLIRLLLKNGLNNLKISQFENLNTVTL